VKSLDIMFMVANGIGIVLYLVLASRGWRLPEQNEIPVTGEPLVWALALPVLGVFFFADIVWGVLILRIGESKRWRRWLVTAEFFSSLMQLPLLGTSRRAGRSFIAALLRLPSGKKRDTRSGNRYFGVELSVKSAFE